MRRTAAYKTFQAEKEYRDHLAEVLGKRIGREQRKTEQAEAEASEMRSQVRNLESELGHYRRRELGEGTPLARTDKLGSLLHDLDASEPRENGA